MSNSEIAKEMKKECLVLDIECSSNYDIRKDFDNYVKNAQTKWIGFYSYKTEKYYNINIMKTNKDKVKEFINEHKHIVSFNGVEFDNPILKNNDLFPEKRMSDLDCQIILGDDIFKHKKRGGLMGYKFKSNSLKNIAKEMELETQKGDIDYKIFEKNEWTPEEEKEIIKYLQADVEVTKQMFDKLFDFWLPFTEFISEKNTRNWSWLTSSIASLVYKSACHTMGWSEEYGNKGAKTDIGGRVILPRVNDMEDAWYVDVTSLYPNIYIMFNLINEVSKRTGENIWHGNEVFKVKGYYDISQQHLLTKDLHFKLKERIRLKKEDSSNPLIYAFKIYLNTFYGISRSEVFKNTHTPNAGSDCCYLGQQINEIMEEKMAELGYKTIYGDTDSIMIKHKDKKTSQEVKSDLQKVVDYILKWVPFPTDTFGIDIEHYLHYIMFVPDSKTGEYKKKNYAYIYTNKKGEKDVKIMGLPIKKTNATELGPLIFEKYIKPKMIEENTGKFDSVWLNTIIQEEAKKNIELLAIEYKANEFLSYNFKGRGCLTAQISKNYLDGNSGQIKLIKNKKIGKVGSSFKYCTLEEARKENLKVTDLDLKKVYNELAPFSNKKIKNEKVGFFNTSGSGTTSIGLKLKSKGYF